MKNWKVLEFINGTQSPKVIQRGLPEDSQIAIFSIGDLITNGSKNGFIQEFNFSFPNDEIFVTINDDKNQLSLGSIEHYVEISSSKPEVDEHVNKFGNAIKKFLDDLKPWPNYDLIERAFEFFLSENILTSRFQIGDQVNVFLKEGTYFNATVIKVAFTKSKVLYDLEYIYQTEESEEVRPGPSLEEIESDSFNVIKHQKLRLYNVDSALIGPQYSEKPS